MYAIAALTGVVRLELVELVVGRLPVELLSGSYASAVTAGFTVLLIVV